MKVDTDTTVFRGNAETRSLAGIFKNPGDGMILVGAHAYVCRHLNQPAAPLGLKAGIRIEWHGAYLNRDGISVDLAIAHQEVAAETARPGTKKRSFLRLDETMRSAVVKFANG